MIKPTCRSEVPPNDWVGVARKRSLCFYGDVMIDSILLSA